MAAMSDANVSVDASGNIRWSSNATDTHTVLEFIQWLMDKQDDGQAAGDDLLDITVSTAYVRSTDTILTLNSPFNIDDNFATHLYDGSVSQTDPVDGGETLYSGLGVIGPVESGTEYVIIQGGKVLPSFWGTGINPEAAPSLVFSRHLVKSKQSGVEIDGGRITVLARELGDQYRRFPVTLGEANSVAAIGNSGDLFNTSTDSTLAGYFGTITNTEGFQDIDIEGTGTTYEFYSQWADGGQSTNDVYEYTKWISQRATKTASYGTFDTHTGAWITVDNATQQGVAQEIVAPANLELLTAVKVTLRFQGTRTSHTGNVYAELYSDSGTIPDTLLARSENIPITRIQNNSTGEDIYFHFNMINPSDGSDQRDSLDMTATTSYWIAIRHDEGTATEYLELDGDITSPTGTEFIATYNGATWTADNTKAINMAVYSAPEIHGIAGDRFEGINVEVGFDGETGTIAETLAPSNPYVFWGTEITYDGGTGTFRPGELVQIYTTSGKTTLSHGGQVWHASGGATGTIIIAQDTLSALADDYHIVGLDSAAECTVNVTINDNDKSGGHGIVLAKDDNGTTGELYIQILSGVAPVNDVRIWSSSTPLSNYAEATASITSRSLNPEFLGISTGSNIIGAYGTCFLPSDVGASDTFFDLSNQQRTPPNNRTFTVSGLVAKEDRVLVGPRSAGALNKAQQSIDLTLSATNVSLISVGNDIPAGTPTNGTLRVELDSGIYRRVRYQSWTDGTGTGEYNLLANDTFTSGDVATGTDIVTLTSHNFVTSDKVRLTTAGTLPSPLTTGTDYYLIKDGANTVKFATSVNTSIDGTQVNITTAGTGTQTIIPQGGETATALADFSGDNATSANDLFLSYIDVLARSDTEAYTAVHTTDVDLFVRVRDGGATPIKTFESASARFLSTDQTVAAVRTNDY